jgi:hypothetical protein
MKPNRDAAALAAALTSAANTPLPLPHPPVTLVSAPFPESESEPAMVPAVRKPRPKAKPEVAETVGITLRPDRQLLKRYTDAAAERTKKEGRVISAQQIMLEVLERGLKVNS